MFFIQCYVLYRRLKAQNLIKMTEVKKEKRGGINFFNCDNIVFMKTKTDNYYDLAIVDPPYGIGAGGKNFKSGTSSNSKIYRDNDWDKIRPPKEYFQELKRVAKNYIIWGGNYFVDLLEPARCYIVWDKKTGNNSYADCEMALTNIDSNAKIYTKFWLGAHANNGVPRIHPTEKPIQLYRWLLKTYAEKGNKILDTHGGSMSISIACDMEGFDLDICEIDGNYFKSGLNAFDNYKMQTTLF